MKLCTYCISYIVNVIIYTKQNLLSVLTYDNNDLQGYITTFKYNLKVFNLYTESLQNAPLFTFLKNKMDFQIIQIPLYSF